jgi:hypothetical protein
MTSKLLKIKYDLIKLYLWNAVFALIGMFVFMMLKDDEFEQMFFVIYFGSYMIYNFVKFGFFYIQYKEFKIQSGIIKENRKNQNDV